MNNGFTSLDDLKKKSGRRFTTFEADGVRLRLRSVTERERAAYEASFINQKTGQPDTRKLPDVKSKFIAMCAVDADGVPIMTADDAAELDYALANALYDRCLEHCMVKNEDDLAAKNSADESDSSSG